MGSTVIGGNLNVYILTGLSSRKCLCSSPHFFFLSYWEIFFPYHVT